MRLITRASYRLDACEAGQHALADPERRPRLRIATRHDDDSWGRIVPLPPFGAREQFSVRVLPHNFKHRYFGKLAGRRIAVSRATRDRTFAFEFLQNAFSVDALCALYAECSREIAFGAM